ncbi:hypothetical protein, conserved [Plasmodium gonderi]|uniref:RAP domain-containing protein n=1 Tax=Plasmodium gonderi TaxID=77519 RepID=A0A1Y1JPN2_PLAGO|nr:hypothetical protein, conserved [Plasmodium gonderi]GAW83448.1 hypothetical protein, conserved [Plasmodium gonderi]
MNRFQRSELFTYGVKYIRTGKFKEQINFKKIRSGKKEELEKELEIIRSNQIKFLELLHLDNLKTPQPKKWNKKKIEHENFFIQNGKKKEKQTSNDAINIASNSTLDSKEILGRYSKWKKLEKTSLTESSNNCNNTFVKRHHKNNALFKQLRLKKNKFKDNETDKAFQEKKTYCTKGNKTEMNLNECRSSVNYENFKDSIISNIVKKKNVPQKKKIHLNNFSITNSYINKKYHIYVRRDGFENNYKISEMKSIEFFDDLGKKYNNGNDSNKMQATSKESEIEDSHNLQTSSVMYENKYKIIKKIYKASINHVRDENLWKKYVQNTFIISVYLDASDIVILFWCFSKIGYRDNRLINLLCSLVLKKINELSCCALALLLNSFKKLEIKKYDTMELLTNQFCLHVSKWTSQDIALVANSLAFFYIYHKTFWKKCILKLQNNYYFSHSLHLCLIISAFARLDIREGNILLSLCKSTKKIAKHFSPNNLALVIHSFAKLKFSHPKFYNFMYQFVHKYLDNQLLIGKLNKITSQNSNPNICDSQIGETKKKNSVLTQQEDIKSYNSEMDENGNFYKKTSLDEYLHDEDKLTLDEITNMCNSHEGVEMQMEEHSTEAINDDTCYVSKNNNNLTDSSLRENKKNEHFDLQSLVLLLFSCTCLISCTEQMILKLTYLIIPHKDHLGNHKVEKLKYVSEYIQYIFPQTFKNFPKEIKDFYYHIDTYEIKKKKINKYGARWINELSRILARINVSHLKNVYINHICADIMLPNSNVIIMCLGPYSYYVNSLVSTSIADLKRTILEKKNYKVIPLTYHEWNKLNDYEEKIHFLYSFGRNAANYLFVNSKKKFRDTHKLDKMETQNISPSMEEEDSQKGGFDGSAQRDQNKGEETIEEVKFSQFDKFLDNYIEQCKNPLNHSNNISDEAADYDEDDEDEIADFIKKGISGDDRNKEIRDNSYDDIADIKEFLKAEKA